MLGSTAAFVGTVSVLMGRYNLGTAELISHPALVKFELFVHYRFTRGRSAEYWLLLREPEPRAPVANHHLELARLSHQCAGGIHESEVASL